jgi:hypothetical protein
MLSADPNKENLENLENLEINNQEIFDTEPEEIYSQIDGEWHTIDLKDSRLARMIELEILRQEAIDNFVEPF